MPKLKAGVFLLLILSLKVMAQIYSGYGEIILINRTPSPRAQAMGSALVSIKDNAVTQFYNPAALSGTSGLNCTYSYSSQYYTLKNAGFNYFGLSGNINSRHSLALSFYSFSNGLVSTSPSSSSFTRHDNLVTGIYTLSYALRIIESFSLGINFNYFYDEIPDGRVERAKVKAYPIDFGLLEKASLSENHRHYLSIGSSIKNLNNAHVEISSEKQWLPSIFKIGFAYEYSAGENMSSDLSPLGFTIQTEYQDVLNCGYYTAIRFGGEIRLYDTIALRCGYYKETLDRSPSLNGLDYIKQFTYGAGIELPLQKIFSNRLPFELSLSYTSLKQPTFVKYYDDWGRYSTAAINIKYINL